MKIVCTQENLNQGLNLVSHIANKNSNLPILNNVLIRAEKEGITLITTDLEIGIKVFVRSKVDEEGSFTVDAKLLNNFINLLPKENITLLLSEDGNLDVSSKNQETTIRGMEAEDFPLIPEISKDNEIEVSSLDLKKSLSQVIFAASLDTTRVEINAVNFNFKGEQLTLVATDSYRLAEKKIKITNQEKENSLIIPLKTLQELLRILSDNTDKKLKMYFNENQIMFSLDGIDLISRVIDGSYPDYKQIIPEKFNTNIKCETDKLLPAIKAVSLFCKQGINDIRMSFDNETNEIVITTASSHAGKSMAKVPAEISGENNDIVFNYRYMIDGLNNIDQKDIFIKINNNTSPGLMGPSNKEDYIYLVMPIRQ